MTRTLVGDHTERQGFVWSATYRSEGDRVARYDFAKLCMPLRPRLLAHAVRLTNGHRMRAEDIVQDALVRAWNNWEDWSPKCPEHPEGAEGAVKAWLYRIVTNVYLNDYAARQSQQRTLDAAAVEQLVQEGNDYVEPATDFGAIVQSALTKIYPGFRQVVEMHYVQGMKCEEIAAELGIGMGTVLSRLWRAREALRPYLAGLARDEYDYKLDGAGKGVVVQPIEVVQADADRVDGVVARDDAESLRSVESTRHELTSRRRPGIAPRSFR